MTIKNGKIYDGSSLKILTESFKSAYGEMNTKKGINDVTTIATGGMYLEQQLREILPDILNQAYPEMPLLKFMPVDNSGALMQSIIQRAQSFEGRHVQKHETANTTGTISVNRTGREQVIVEYEAGSSYSDTDLQRSILLNENIDSALIEGHNISYMTIIDQIGFEGIYLSDGTKVTDGLSNYTNVISSLVNTATAAFSSATGLQIYNDIALLYNEMIGQAGGAEELRPTTIVLPPLQYGIISAALMTGTSPVTGYLTVREFIEKNLNVKIYASNRMKAKGTAPSGSDRLVMFNNDRRNIRFHLPQPLQFAPIFVHGFKYDLQSKFRIAGLGINRNNAIGYLDGI